MISNTRDHDRIDKKGEVNKPKGCDHLLIHAHLDLTQIVSEFEKEKGNLSSQTNRNKFYQKVGKNWQFCHDL